MSAGRQPHLFQPGSYFRPRLLEFVLPLLVLLPVRFGFGEQGRLSLEIFLAGTGLELLLCFALGQARAAQRIGPRKFYFYDFLIRLVVGLPFTVYLIVSAPYSIIGLLRFFPALANFLERHRFRFAVQFYLFFILGALFFAMLKDFPYPGKVQSITIVVGALLGGLLFLREFNARRREHSALTGERDRRRLTRRLRHVEEREKASLDAMMPPTVARLFREDRELHPEGGRMLVAQLRFPDVHASLLDFADSVDSPSRQKGFDDFAAEWNRFLSYVLDGARKKQYQVARRGEALYCTRPLPGGPADDTAEIRVEAFRMIFWLQEVLRYAERTRRTLHTRGRSGWRILAALAQGEAAGLPQGGGSPAWMLLGPAVHELETFLASTPTETRSDLLWVQPAIDDLIHSCYEEGSGSFYHGWYTPGFLRKDFAFDETGVEPASDFFDRLKYKDES